MPKEDRAEEEDFRDLRKADLYTLSALLSLRSMVHLGIV